MYLLKEFSSYIASDALGLAPGSRLGGAVDFFIYDSIKIFLLLSIIIFAISLLRSYFPPDRAKRILSHKKQFIGNILAALLGVVTPFCSCSAVPLFIGFVEAGIPLGVTFSFLISSPMVNEVAIVLLWGLFGWKIAALYIGAGLLVAFFAGLLLGKFHMEKWVEEGTFNTQKAPLPFLSLRKKITFRDRALTARHNTMEIVRKVWLYIVIAIAIGGFIHGYVPENFLALYAGRNNPFAVPLAVLIGVPLYSNAAGIIPVAHALIEKGLGMGTVLAFMMAVTALSLPEMIILRKVLKVKLLAVFAGILTVSIITLGYLFNLIL